MKKTMKARHAGFLAIVFAFTGWISAAPAARAQYQSRRDVLSNASYERMRQYAHELDERAEHANAQAQARQAGYRGFRRDTKFLKSIDHFADRARAFHQRMDTYRTRPWNVDEEIQHLIRDARNVQSRLRRARFVDRHTVADWDKAVRLLNQMASEYQAGISPYGTHYPGGSHPEGQSYPPGTVPHPNDGSSDDRYGSGRAGDIRQLARELEDRAARASDLVNRYGSGRSGYSSDIQHFSEQAVNFRSQVESNRLSPSELRSQVNHLLEDAQTADQELRRQNVSRELAAEWTAIVRILTQMRDLAV
ncbi:MAG TPA: hypothetical protein VGB47_10290 [Thermoanaerobaculia bacterium]